MDGTSTFDWNKVHPSRIHTSFVRKKHRIPSTLFQNKRLQVGAYKLEVVVADEWRLVLLHHQPHIYLEQ